LDYKKLGDTYPAISVYSDDASIGCGNRIVYWVGSDGTRCVVYNCVGAIFVVSNEDLSLKSVINAAAYSFDGGRLRFKDKNSMWVDAGPLRASAVRDDDPDLTTIKSRAGKETSLEDMIDDAGSDTTWEGGDW
jgi:hypothetical protein